jgi:hypothetical protein
MGDAENVGVIEPGAQTGEQEITVPADNAGGEGKETREERENRIPISRAEEMWKRREQKLRQELEEKELNPLRQKVSSFEADQKRLVEAELARLQKMGWYTPEAPKPVTQDQLEKLLSEKIEAVEKKSREERVQMFHQQRITDGWRIVAKNHPELAKEKFFQDAVLASYAENPQQDFVDIAESYVKRLEAVTASRANASNEERNARRDPSRRVVPGGRGAAGGAGNKEEKKLTIAEKIAAKLRANKGEG